MAIIPDRILLIEKKIEQQLITQDFREHIGASSIGHPCLRKSWYGFRWATKREITPRLQRLFNRGHAEEIVVIEDLINAGCSVEGINMDESIKKRFKTVFGVDLPEHKQKSSKFSFGHGGASCDGIVKNLPDAPKTPHLLEVKTSNTKKFADMKRLGLEKAKPAHYIQMQIYMSEFTLTRGLYVMVCKETDERYYERIRAIKEVAVEYRGKADYIVTSETPPPRMSENKSHFQCTWCDERFVCHSGQLPHMTCRTCIHASIENDGVWSCDKKGKTLSKGKQEKACKKYKVLEVI